LIARILEGRGAVPTCVGNANDALSALKDQPFDLMLSDVGMPDMDGYQLMQEIRKLPEAVARIPSIAVTAYARAEDRQRSLLFGYQMHIAKPVDARELVAAISGLLTVSRR
jgi:CheY-like chemotaxis protein